MNKEVTFRRWLVRERERERALWAEEAIWFVTRSSSGKRKKLVVRDKGNKIRP